MKLAEFVKEIKELKKLGLSQEEYEQEFNDLLKRRRENPEIEMVAVGVVKNPDHRPRLSKAERMRIVKDSRNSPKIDTSRFMSSIDIDINDVDSGAHFTMGGRYLSINRYFFSKTREKEITVFFNAIKATFDVDMPRKHISYNEHFDFIRWERVDYEKCLITAVNESHYD